MAPGSDELEAAIEGFHLDEPLHGARAIDLGASSGAFAESLLRRGAAHVTAVSVGRHQPHHLPPGRLRDDARVASHERVHWKTLPLTELPGPFDFFIGDTSVIAARVMLRGLSFRLRDGAEGLVVIRPEVGPKDPQLKNSGAGESTLLRKRVVETFRDKAKALGFEVRACLDARAAGGGHAVAIWAHLRFVKRSARQKTARTAAPDAFLGRYFAIAAPGLEAAVLDEVRGLAGAHDAMLVDGGVEFAGPLELLYRANLWLRVATRVVLRLGEFEARDFAKLRQRAAALPWAHFLRPETVLDLSVTAARSRLYHTGAIAENLERAVAGRLGGSAAGAGSRVQRILVRVVNDLVTISLDSSGELLHKRGWRTEGVAAPMRETLAAGLIACCQWDPNTSLIDPMCGSGTIPIEACGIALGRAPGLSRDFAFQGWPVFDAQRFAEEKTAAAARELSTLPASICGSDAHAGAVGAAQRNAERADVAAHVRLARVGLTEIAPPVSAKPGLVLVNPPYGRRLGEPREILALFKQLGRTLAERFGGWRAGIVIADRRQLTSLGLRPTSELPLRNGGLRVSLYRFELPIRRSLGP